MHETVPEDRDKKIKIRHNTFDQRTGEPITITVDQRGREKRRRRGMGQVDPQELSRTRDRRTDSNH